MARQRPLSVQANVRQMLAPPFFSRLRPSDERSPRSSSQKQFPVTKLTHPIHISKFAIAALTFPAAPAAIIRVVAMPGAPDTSNLSG